MAWYEYEPARQPLYRRPGNEPLSFKNSLIVLGSVLSLILLPIVWGITLFLLVHWLLS
jgi:hypothetical protein